MTHWPAKLLGVVALALPAGVAASPAKQLLSNGQYTQAYQAAVRASEHLVAADAASLQARYYDKSWADRAVQAARRAVQAEPKNASAHFALAKALGVQAVAKGASLAVIDIAKESRAAAERALQLAPSMAEAKAMIAAWHSGAWSRVGALSGADLKLARQLAKEALASAPNSVFVHSVVGTVFVDLKEGANAKSVLNKALGLKAADAYERELQKEAQLQLARLK